MNRSTDNTGRMPSEVTHVWVDDVLVEGPWERIDPPAPCSSPDGHLAMDVLAAGRNVPVRAFCGRCGAGYSIVAAGLTS